MWESIATLFEGFGAIAMIIFAVGIIFCIVEIFIPGFGVFGITGTVLIAGGIVMRYLLSYDIEQLIFMVLFVITIVFLAAIIMLYSAKHGMLYYSPFIEEKTSISTTYSQDNKDFVKLLGKVAFCESNFTPAGKFVLEGDTYEARSYGEYIEKGTKIQVVEVSGNTIYIKKVV